MNILDTNIVSELMRQTPSQPVIDWVNDQDSHTLFITTVTLGEIEYGLQLLPTGKRQSTLRAKFEHFITQAFSHRVLPYDAPAAKWYGTIMSKRRQAGRPTSSPDGQIAAIARAHSFKVITRNIKDFDDCDVELLNPF